MNNKVVSFPHLSNYDVPIKYLIEKLTDAKVIPSPSITKKTIELGSKYSPDYVCMPFKYTLGNYIESLDNGANILIQAGGGCRFGYYFELQKKILEDLGYKFEIIKEQPWTFIADTILKCKIHKDNKKMKLLQ